MTSPGQKPSEKPRLTLVPPSGEPPSQFRFSLLFEEGRALLNLHKGTFFDIAHILDLELEVPKITFPVDVSEGAQTFRKTECLINHLELNIYEDKLNEFIAHNIVYSRLGLEELRVHFLKGGFLVSGVFRGDKGSSRFTFKGSIETESDGWIRGYFHDLRVYGSTDSPAPLIYFKFLEPLAPYSFSSDGIGSFQFSIYYLLFDVLFPLAGWKTPSSEGLYAAGLAFSRERLSLRLKREEEGLSRPVRFTEDPLVLRLRESAEFLRECDALLAQERGISAAQAYELKRAENPFNPVVVERLIHIYGSSPETHAQAIEIGEGYVQKGKETPAVLGAMGAVFAGRGDHQRSAFYYERLREIAQEENSLPDTIFSSLALADALASHDPARASSLCEHVLEIDYGNVDALRALTGLYEKQGLWDKAVRSYTQLIEAAAEVSSQLSSLLKIGEIYEVWLSDLDRAGSTYSDALSLSPDCAPAWEGMARVHLKKGDPLKAVAVYEELLKGAREVRDLERAAAIHADIGQVWESSNDLDQAVLHYTQALESRPEYEPVLEKLAGIWSRQRAWQKVIPLYEQMLRNAQKAEDVKRMTGVLYTIGKLWQEKLKDYPRAEENYQALLSIDPGYVPALEGLGQIYMEKGDFESLLAVYRQQTEYISDPRRLSYLFHESGKVLDSKLNRREEAIACFRRAVVADPTYSPPWDHLGEIYRQTEDWGSLAKTYKERALALKDLNRSMAFLMEAAQLYEEKLGNLQGAEGCYKEAVTALPMYLPALGSLARLYRDQERWEELLEVYDTQTRAVKDVKRLVPIYLNMGSIWKDALSNPEMAVAAFEHALVLDPQCLPAIHAMQEIFTVTNDWASLCDALRKETEIVTDRERLLMLYQDTASIALTRLGRKDLGKEAYRRALDLDPGNPHLLTALAEVYAGDQEWEELIQVYNSLAESAADPRAGAAYDMAAGELWEKRLSGPDLAVLSYRKALKKNPRSIKAAQALGRLYLQEQRWEDLIEVYSHLAGIVQQPEKAVELLCLAGRIWWEKLRNSGMAVHSFRMALDKDPRSIPSIVGLISVYRAEKTREPLLSAYENLAALLNDPPKSARFLVHAAQGWQGLGNEERGISCLCKALEWVPTHAQALEGLMDIMKGRGRWGEWIEYAARRADAYERPEDALGLHIEIARVWKEELGDLRTAEEKYKNVLLLDPANAQAASALEGIYTGEEKWEDLIYILMLKTRSVQGTTEAAKIYTRIGSVYREKLAMEREAREAFETALESDPGYAPPFTSLEALYTTSGAWAEISSLYETRAKALGPGDEAAGLYIMRGGVLEKKLGMPQEALASYKEAHRLAPAASAAIERITGLARAQGWTGELIKVLVARAGREDKARAALTYCEASDALSRIPGQEKNRERFLVLARESDPECIQAMKGLESLYEGQGRWEEFAGILMEETGREKGHQKKGLLLTVGETLENRIGDVVRAEKAYSEALSLDPGDLAVLRRLERVAEKKNDHARLAEILEEEVQALGSDPQAVVLLTRLGALYEERLGLSDRAIAAFERAVTLAPDLLEALSALRRLYKAREDWPSFVTTCTRIIPVLSRDEEKSSVSLEMAQALRDSLGKPVDAVSAFRSAIDWDPKNVRAREALIQVLFDGERHEEARQACEEMIRTLFPEEGPTEHPDKVLSATVTLGRCEEKLGHTDEAEKKYMEAVGIDNAYLPGWQALADFLYSRALRAEEAGGRAPWPVVRVAHEKVVLLAPKSRRVAPTYMRLGEIIEKLGKEEEALFSYRQAVDLDPSLEGAGEALARLYRKHENWEDLVALYKTQLLVATDPEAIFMLHNEIAALSEDRLKAWDEAIMNYLQALEVKPDYVRAHERLYDLYVLKGQWEEAASSLKIILASGGEPRRISELTLTLGDIYEKRLSGEEAALGLYEESADADPANITAWEAMARLAENMGRWEKAAEALEELTARSAPDTKRDYAERLGTIYREKMGRIDLAIRSYEVALSCDSQRKEVHLALAETYRASAPNLQKSVQEYMWLVLHEPFALGYYDGLRQVYERMGLNEEAEAVASAAAFLDPTAPGGRVVEPSPVKKPMTDEMRRLILHPLESTPLRLVIIPLAPRLSLFSPAPGQPPFIKRAREAGRTHLPSVKSLWDEVSSLIGVGTIACSLTDGSVPDGCWFTPSGTVCWSGTLLKSLSLTEARFAFGRALEMVKAQYPVLQRVKAEEWSLLLQSLRAMLKGEKPPKRLGWSQRRFMRRVKKVTAGLEERAKQVLLSGLEKIKVQDWLQGMVYRAGRAGLLAAGGIGPAVSGLLKMKGQGALADKIASEGAGAVLTGAAGASIPPALRSEIADLLLFSISRHYLSLRRSLT